MSRVFVRSPEAQALLRDYLIPAYLKHGSMRSLCTAMNAHSVDPIYANRLFSLFSDDGSLAVNPGTFEIIAAAAKKMDLTGWEREAWEVYPEDPPVVRRFLEEKAGGRKAVPEEKLREFIFACNDLRSSQAEARGYTSGQRIHALKDAEKRHAKALLELSDWAEELAREQIGERSFA